MTPECLVKLKNIVTEETYNKLSSAVDEGDQKAWDFTMQETHADMKMIRRDAIIDANRKASIVDYITQQSKKGIKPQKALMDILSGSGTRQKSGVVSLDKYIEGVRGEFVSMNIDLIDATRPTLLGLRRASNPEFIRNIVKGIFGDADASVSKGGQSIIDAWHRTTKTILNRFNKAGGRIQELQGFNIPVNHYSPAMLIAGEDKWVRDAMDLFNIRERMDMDQISDEDLLRKIYKNIVTDGTAEPDFGQLGKRNYKKLGNSHQQFRFLQPKSGDAWLSYTTKYGRHNNPVDSMKEYMDSMATEIGLLEVLGTNPTKMVDDIVESMRTATKDNRAGSLALASLDQIRSRNPGVEDNVTNTFRNLRAIQTIVKLPLSGITATSDIGFSTVRSMYLGMNPVRVFARQMRNLVTRQDYKTAGRHGLLAEYAAHKAVSANKYTDSLGFSKLDRVADFSVRASGLNHWTNSARSVFGLEFLSNMAQQSQQSWSSLSKGMRNAFERYGITPEDWTAISKATDKIGRESFIDPMSTALDDGLRSRIIGMVRSETNLAVPEPNAKSKALASFGTPTNTVANEMIRTVNQFKTFGITVLTSNMGVMLDKGLPIGTRMAYGASLLTSTSIMGVIVLQLKDIAKGRKPRPVTPELVKEGMIQGGSMGVAGDMFFNDPNLFGGLPAYLAGPTIGDLQRIWKVMNATKDEVLKEGGNWQKELYPAGLKAAEEIAFPLRLWQTRVATERLMLDQARRLVDPDYYSKLRRTRKWMRTERGQEYWSAPK